MSPPVRASAAAEKPSRRRQEPWLYGEPEIKDLMEDPITLLVMKRDGLRPEDVWPWIVFAQAGLKARLCQMTPLAA